ncbi:FkbM family methyltransferase [Aetokthonos hydrillicola Thurmond2011]|jgi:FkbM family methyltransferase|uniref:FkbM family methyltransferase n=1 Tax=Aetokthonos hydrillicola Thurmond2011 TaxID=2712845 RepID=A0AAP5IFU1_9CYAN|nr:FkbM family methyltransferase [Aetokthonos hydrillicola]MBO3460995.1 FkbM family methyltransferase [Aetokthonos hydrillicola CCALA 1050]MBW4588436.1 FkbM family methyltransferase [Aetokthonos hydrillicola CCALA 1050]MDR9900805.1 FkbM family methyltransferase [Aetokthonos hydrillicola Thurmond2011]
MPDLAPEISRRSSPYPGDWIFNRSILEWMFEPSLRKQLPILYQIFSLYCYLYVKITGNTILKEGRRLFLAIAKLSNKLSPQDYLEIQLPKYKAYLVPGDPRSLHVVNELLNDSTDTRILSTLLSQGHTFIDVGANHGSFSIIASKLVGVAGHVISIEPQPMLAKATEKSLAANALSSFQVHQIAVGNFNGEIELLIPIDTSGSAGIYSKHSATDKHQKVKVPIRCFDDAIDWQNFSGKTFIKLDIEGSEYAFLTGARKMITSLKPNLMIEIHPGTLEASGTKGEDLKSIMKELGYKQYAELDNLEETFPIEDLNTDIYRNLLVFH